MAPVARQAPDDPPPWLPGPARAVVTGAGTAAGMRRLGWGIVVLAVLALAVLVGRGGSRPKDPYLVDSPPPPTTAARPAARIPGFTEEAMHPATAPARCVAVADTDVLRQKGLMGRTDLAGYDGMAFVFDADTTDSFYMRNTPLPLTVAFFDSAGVLVASRDMVPCPDREGCPLYSADRPYRLALEVKRGDLKRLGLARGSVVSFGGSCP
jgi:uncharacterized membrane protein (UPF0127 family)